jgi:hypothetical protein
MTDTTKPKGIQPIPCFICEAGMMHHKVEVYGIYYNDKKYPSPLLYVECDNCGSESCTYEQSIINKEVSIAFKKWVDDGEPDCDY